MDDGLLRRLSNICKAYYTLGTIDDLFLYAGAKSEWKIDDSQITDQANPSQRVRCFYGWAEGIKANSPDQLDKIIAKVISQIITNEEVPEKSRNVLTEELKELDQKKSQGIELEPLLSTLARSLASDGLAREVAILTSAETRLDWVGHDNYGEVDIYSLVLSVPYKFFDQIHDDLEVCQQNILNHIWPLLISIEGETINNVIIACKLLEDDKWREKALAWLTGQNVNNQGRVRSDNVASRLADGLQFRSEPEIHLYKAFKSLGVSFAPLPVFVRGGQEYRRIEPDFVIFKEGIVLVVEVDGDTFHKETPAEAYNRTTMLEHEGARVVHVQASECETPEKASVFAKKILQTIGKYKEAR